MMIGPTEISIHPATMLVLAWAVISGAVPMLLTAFGSILLHEGAHATAAALAGELPEEIELTPLGAVMRLEDEERLPALKRALMILAGPAMTLLLCFIAVKLTQIGWLPLPWGRRLFAANLSILLINLLPALPLDGGRIMVMLLSRVLRAETLRKVVRGVGTLLGLLCIVSSVWITWRYGGWNLSLAAAGCFLMYSASAATTARAMSELRRLMDRKIRLESRGYAACRAIAVMADMPLQRMVKLLPPQEMAYMMLIERGTMRQLGMLVDHEAVAAYLDHPGASCLEAFQRVQKPQY
ncbi:MAG: hypothetical protein IKK57_07285 [Clostridia bacterium]|nr:hypothetical protein [Clostridia bacterium]